MRISDWSSDVCSSDLDSTAYASFSRATTGSLWLQVSRLTRTPRTPDAYMLASSAGEVALSITTTPRTLSPRCFMASSMQRLSERSEEHTSELQSLMRISYAVFCLKKKKTQK